MLYKRNPKYIYYRLAVAMAFPMIFVLSIGKDWFFAPFLVLVLFFTSAKEFYLKNLRAVHFKEKGVVFYYWESFQKKAMLYKAEALSYYNDPYATGLLSKAERKLTLYYRGERLFKSIGNPLEGWSDDQITQIVKDLEQAGINKEKYLQY